MLSTENGFKALELSLRYHFQGIYKTLKLFTVKSKNNTHKYTNNRIDIMYEDNRAELNIFIKKRGIKLIFMSKFH